MSAPLRLLEGVGLEIELMLVDPRTLDVVPCADRVLARARGDGTFGGDAPDEDGMGWSNELVLHVLEVKNEAPVPALARLEQRFAGSIGRLARHAGALGARLLPGGMHPWMDPRAEALLWPHEYAEVYAAYDRLFDCRRHGWANLQSVHLNLAFGDDEELLRLHAAARLVLPLIPALCASSPIVEGRVTGALDNRLLAYRDNARRVPLMTGRVVPEPIEGRAQYHAGILEPLWGQLLPLDPEGLLREEFANARGAIARFDRNALEIRLIDSQERPTADVAVCALVTEAVRSLVQERHADLPRQHAWPTDTLADVLDVACVRGPATPVPDALARALGHARAGATAADVWRTLRDEVDAALDARHAGALDLILDQGTLAERLLRATGSAPDRARLHGVWTQLAEGLLEDEPFTGGRG